MLASRQLEKYQFRHGVLSIGLSSWRCISGLNASSLEEIWSRYQPYVSSQET